MLTDPLARPSLSSSTLFAEGAVAEGEVNDHSQRLDRIEIKSDP